MRPTSASAAPRLIVVVVLPTPPFWLHMAMIRAGPWLVSGAGSGNSGSGRPVGPSAPTPAFSVPGRGSSRGWGSAVAYVDTCGFASAVTGASPSLKLNNIMLKTLVGPYQRALG